MKNRNKNNLSKNLLRSSKGLKKLVTEKKESNKVRDRFKNELQDWHSTFNSVKDLIMVLDTKFKILKANLETSKFLKRPLSKIVGKTCYKLIHGIDIPPRECPLNMIIKTKKYEEAECYLSEKDIWLRVADTPVFDDNGKMIKIVHIVRDITEFKRTEASLRESEGRFRAIFDHANHGIHIVDMAEKKNLMVNKTLCQMMGYSKEEFKKLRTIDIYLQQDIAYIMEQFRKLLKKEIDIARDIPLVRKDNSILYTDVSASPVMLGGKTYLMGIFRDIGERKKT